MTTEEKAKAHDDALRRAKELHEAGNVLTKTQMEIIFPELAESEDERIRKEMLEDIIVFVSGYADKRVVAKWVSFLKSLHPVKQEWTEEDERILKGIIGKIDHDQTYGVSKVEMLSFLRFLNPQPKQEWSKEETKDLVHILKVLDDCYAYGKHDLSKTDHDNLTSTIKSLRPSWKPSEEQMKWLKDVIETVPMTCRQQVPLESLYNDLKKLM